MTKPIIIVGAGENGRVIQSALTGQRDVSGFLDDFLTGPQILGKLSTATKYIKTHEFFVAIGNNINRRKTFNRLQKLKVKFINVLHPLSHVDQLARFGTNVFVGAMSFVNTGSIIGDAVFINNGCIVEHDNVIESYVHLAPGAITGGGVKIGAGSFIGLGARVNDHLTVGHDTIVGSGTVVIDDLPSNVTAVGVPAKIIKH